MKTRMTVADWQMTILAIVTATDEWEKTGLRDAKEIESARSAVRWIMDNKIYKGEK